jgi:Domain of unknown function (DUF1843)
MSDQSSGGAAYNSEARPYGAAMRDAIASGDSTRLSQVSERARTWLSENGDDPEAGEVKRLLGELDSRTQS